MSEQNHEYPARPELLEGALLPKQMKLVQAWIALHAEERMADWMLAAEGPTL